MAENIELRSFSIRNQLCGDIEECHEIKHGEKHLELLETASFISKFSPEAINDNDFFIHDGKHDAKEGTKKKKRKKKEKPTNIMDVISSELASLTEPVTENLIEVVEDRKNYLSAYVQNFSREQRKYQRRKTIIDSEYGQSRITRPQKLSPIYPNLSETFTEDSLPEIPVEYVRPTSFSSVITEYENQPQDKQRIRFLDIELKDMKFKHHHNFSLEDVLCLKLVDTYKEYEKLQDTLKGLYHDIKVNRETKDNLRTDLLKVSPNKKDDIRFDATVRKYAGQLFNLKEKYKDGYKLKKELIHQIVSIWSDIEMVREKVGHKDTPYILKIDKQTLSRKEYEKAWNSLYEEEWTDKLAKIEYDYATKYVEYHEFKKDVGNDSKSKKKISKPKLEIDEEAIKEEVEQIVNNIVVRDIIDIRLETDEKSINEIKFLRHIYHFEVYIDKVFVCESEQHTSMDKWHNITFSEYFSVEILPNNEIIRLNLLENEENVAQVQANLNDFRRKEDQDYIKLQFVYDKDVDPTPYAVGSGSNIKDIAAENKVRLKSSNSFKENLKTACEVNANIRWNQNIELAQCESIKASLDIGSKLRRLIQGIDEPNVEDLCDIIRHIYGKDVTNDETMITTLMRLCKLEPKVNEQFEIEENSAEFVRLKLLHLRNIGGFTDVENKMVPVHGSQISTEQLNCLQKTKEKDFDLDYLRNKEADMDPIELQRFIGTKFMQKLNKKMLKNLNEHLMVKTRKDVMCEFQQFNWRGLFLRGNNATPVSISNGAKQQILFESLSKEQEIQITVQRAFNLMDRTIELVDEDENNEEIIAGYRVRPLRPFVRVSYRSASAQTVTAIGCHPSWNHTLKLSTKLDPLSSLQIDIFDSCKVHIQEGSDDQSTLSRTVHYRYFNKWLGTVHVPLFAVLSLGTLRGTLKVNSPPVVFGYETVQNKGSQSLIPEVARLMKKQTSYIALHITTGLSHLGGFQDFTQPLPSSVEDDYIIKHLNNFVTDFINDFPNRNITLNFIDSAGKNKCVTQFLQPIPLPNREYFPKNPKSCGSAMSKSSGFSRSSSSKSSGRKREVDLEANDEKESVYSQETSLKGVDSLMKTINACLRYVALIPCYEITDTHVVTLMGLELLKVLHGSPLDHTILLASYFLYLGIKSWVAIGLGLPRGRSSYVLIQYDLTARRFVLTSDELFKSRGFLNRNEGYLWYVCDAVTGDRHELRDVGCPMKTVEYVFDNDNIWVNVQSSQDCENVSFDLSKSSDWQTVFDKDIFVMKQPIVNEAQLYSAPGKVESLRQSLEAKIKGKVQKWRPHMKTIWNRYCSGLLRDALPFWEYWSFNPSDSKPGFSHKVKQLMVTYRMYGFPLNMPFVNTKSVTSTVKATGLHLNDEPGVEFGLAVEVFSYPNNVLSVWVYLATIARQ